MRMFKVKIREATMGVDKLQKEFDEKMQGGMFGFGMNFDKIPVDEEFAAEIRGDIRKLTKDLKQLELEQKNEKLRVDKELKSKFDLSELEAIEKGILDKSEEQINKCVKRMAEKVELTVQIQKVDKQIKNLHAYVKNKFQMVEENDDAILSKRPLMGGFSCASCEKKITNGTGVANPEFVQWNKMPQKEMLA